MLLGNQKECKLLSMIERGINYLAKKQTRGFGVS